jgi:hypothetical protein
VSLHFSGHGNRASGLEWNGVPQFLGRQICRSPAISASLIKLQHDVANIDSFFLKACCTLTTGRELHASGIRVVVELCAGKLPSLMKRLAILQSFYEFSCPASGQYSTAFETACTEQWGALLEARPCLLQTGSGLKFWNGKKLVTSADKHLHSLVPVEPKPTL